MITVFIKTMNFHFTIVYKEGTEDGKTVSCLLNVYDIVVLGMSNTLNLLINEVAG